MVSATVLFSLFQLGLVGTKDQSVRDLETGAGRRGLLRFGRRLCLRNAQRPRRMVRTMGCA